MEGQGRIDGEVVGGSTNWLNGCQLALGIGSDLTLFTMAPVDPAGPETRAISGHLSGDSKQVMGDSGVTGRIMRVGGLLYAS